MAKRPVGRPASRKCANSDIDMRCNAVGEALLGAAGFPISVLEVLKNGLPQTLAVPKEQRHSFQEQVIGMVGEVLNSVEAASCSKIEGLELKLDGAAGEKAARAATREATAAQSSAKKEATEAAVAALVKSTGDVAAAKAALATAVKEQTTGDAELVEAATKRERLVSALEGTFKPLKEGTVEVGKAKEGVAAVLEMAKAFSFEATLLIALPKALASTPSTRGAFDTMVFAQVQDEFEKCKATLDATLAAGEPAKIERATKVAAATSELSSADEVEKACKAAMVSAKASQKDAEAARDAASKAEQDFEPEMASVASELELAKTTLQAFRDGPLAAFKALVEYTLPIPAPEKAEVPTDAVAADAPSAAAEGKPAAEGEAAAEAAGGKAAGEA